MAMRFKNIFLHAVRNPRAVIPFILTLPSHFRLVSKLMADPRVLLVPKLLFLGSLLYLVSPFDLIPDFLVPVLGWTDDLFIVLSAAKHLITVSPPEVVEEHVHEIRAKSGK